MENIRCDAVENLWPDQQERQDVHQDGQITDTITRFWSMNEMCWVSNYILQMYNKVLKFQQTVVTFTLSLENVKTVSKNVPKQLRKTLKYTVKLTT